MQIKTQWFSHGSKISGCASILGSWQICHQVCTSLIAAVATFGIALQGMPLLFLNKWQWPLWIAAVALFGVLLIVKAKLLPAAPQYQSESSVRGRQHKSLALCITTRGVFGNAGLLMAGAPFAGDAISQIRLIGLIVVLAVLLWYLKDLVVKRVETGWAVDFVEQGRKVAGGLVGVVAVVVLLAIGGGPASGAPEAGPPDIAMAQSTSRMKFTLFDIAHAKELMDKNGDGACDACGMAIDQCIESGMMECTMDPDAKIGLLGSQHIHARFNVFRSGQTVDLAPFAHTMDAQGNGTGSSFIHVEGPDFNKLHMHASGVPLQLWFDSISMETRDVKVMVNGKETPQGLEYVFKDGENINVNISPPLTGGTPVVPPPLVGGVRGGVKSFTTPT